MSIKHIFTLIFILGSTAWSAPKYLLSFPDLQINLGTGGFGASASYYKDSLWGVGAGIDYAADGKIPGGIFRSTQDLRLIYRPVHSKYYSREWQFGLGAIYYENLGGSEFESFGWSAWGPSLRIESDWLFWYHVIGLKAKTYAQFYSYDWKPKYDLGLGLGLAFGH